MFLFVGRSVAAVTLATVLGCAVTGQSIHVPSQTIDPVATDSALIQEVRHLILEGNGDAAIVCIVRFDHVLSDRDLVALMEVADPLKGSRSDTWYLYTSAATVDSLLASDRVLWMGEYKPEYRMGRRADTVGEEPRWMHIVSFAGNDPQFIEAMNAIGLDDIRYDSVLEEYHVRADARQIEALCEMWWVKEIYKAGGSALWWTMSG